MFSLMFNLNFRHLVLPKFFSKINFANEIGIFLQFKCHFHDQPYFSVIAIYVQLCKHSWYKKQSQKKKTGRINLINA